VAGFCEQSCETLGSIKSREFVEQPSSHSLLTLAGIKGLQVQAGLHISKVLDGSS
jgi:hypothetical protein